jgi:glycosyltransferase involved in cell wall biosynthesis
LGSVWPVPEWRGSSWQSRLVKVWTGKARHGSHGEGLVKISCILASFNRPTFLRQALKSVVDQTHKDYQLVVVDDSTKMNIFEIMPQFEFTESVVIHENVSASARARVSRLGVNINTGLEHATGDVIVYLADDDYYFPGWFEAVSRFFESHPDVKVGFGILKYSSSLEMDLAECGEIRFWNEVVNPSERLLDHNQVAHRRFDPPQKWQEGLGTESNSDFWFFTQIANEHAFHPINSFAAVKRLHGKNLQNSISLYQSGKMDDLRE